MKRNLFLFVILSLFIALGCDDKAEVEGIKDEKSLIMCNVVNSFKLNNDSVLEKIKQKADEDNFLFISLNDHKTKTSEDIIAFDFEDATVYEYDNSDVKSVMVEGCGKNNIKYTMASLLSKNDIVSKESLIFSQEFISEKEVITGIYSSNYDLIFKVHIKNEEIVSIKTFKNTENRLKVAGWWDRWGECIGRAMNRMSSGTVAGSVEAMVCVAFGPSCAVGTTLGCAGRATFFD